MTDSHHIIPVEAKTAASVSGTGHALSCVTPEQATPAPARIANDQNETGVQTLLPAPPEAETSPPAIPSPETVPPPDETCSGIRLPEKTAPATAEIASPPEEAETTSLPRLLLYAFLSLCAAFGIVVYLHLTLEGAGSIAAAGIGKIALGEVFGASAQISVRTLPPDTPDTENHPTQPLLPLPGTTDTLPPANEKTESESDAAVPIAEGEIRMDYASRSTDGLGLINETPYTPVLSELIRKIPAIPSLEQLFAIHGEDVPIVLILHTHGTEGFSDSFASGYHTTDREKSVYAVGSALAEVLEEEGIPTVHCETLFDEDAFDSAYYNAACAIREYLLQYPSISYILDVHRDAILLPDGKSVQPYTEIDGVGYAQMMFVVGTDHGGSGHTGWQDNLALAARLQANLHTEAPGLMRDINLRSASFNEQYTKGSLLLEIGAAASSTEEAIRSARMLGHVLAAEIRSPKPIV